MKRHILLMLLSVYAIQLWQCRIPPPPAPLPEVTDEHEPLTSTLPCRQSLWLATYGAMSRFGVLKPNATSPYDRHNLKHRCVVDVRGVIQSISPHEVDGDVKILLQLSVLNYTPFGSYPAGTLTNEHNKGGLLTVEIVCAAPKQLRGTGKDPKTKSAKFPNGLDWKWPGIKSPVTDSQNDGAVVACMNYTNPVAWQNLKKDDEILVTGELITDTGPETNKDPKTKDAMPIVPGHGGMEIHPVTSLTRLWSINDKQDGGSLH